jgi:hypothetical protein
VINLYKLVRVHEIHEFEFRWRRAYVTCLQDGGTKSVHILSIEFVP